MPDIHTTAEPTLLVVKTSSLGDVLHAMPAVAEAAQAGFCVDWMVEEEYADVVRLHPGVNRVVPCAIRRWRKSWRTHREEIRQFFSQLRHTTYNHVIDSQGLIKSALLARAANGPASGFSHTTAREPWAAFGYEYRINVPKQQHAVLRQRQLFAQVLGYTLSDHIPSVLELSPQTRRQIVLLHGTAWQVKLWPEPMWVRLAQLATQQGYEVLLTWGNEEEQQRAQRIAAAVSGVTLLDKRPIDQLAPVFAQATGVIGVDTGLTHLSAALGVPTLGLYGPTDAQLTGCSGARTQTLQSSLDCSPCVEKTCQRYRGEPLRWEGEVVSPPCFAQLTPERVWAEAQRHFQQDTPQPDAAHCRAAP